MAHRILYYMVDGSTEKARQILREWGMDEQIELVGCAHEPLVDPNPAQMAGCEGFIGEFGPVSSATADAMAQAGIRIVSSMSIGVNHVDVAALARHGIITTNCPGYCSLDVAQHATGLMLDLMRKITLSNRKVLDGAWEPTGGYASHRTQGQTIGLVFFGNIARSMANIAQALGMNVVVWAPTKTHEELAQAGCTKMESLDELLAASDVVSLHCPLIPQTENLIGAHELEIMKPSAFLINTARGPIVDEEALLDALNEGISSNGARGIQGAALDVLADETAPNRALIEHPRCIVTPHAAFCTEEANDTLRRMTLKAQIDYLVHGITPEHVITA